MVLGCAVLSARRVGARVYGKAVEVVFAHVDLLARKLPTPEVPKYLQIVVYLGQASAVAGVSPVRTLNPEEPFALLGEFFDLTHDALCHPRLLPRSLP